MLYDYPPKVFWLKISNGNSHAHFISKKSKNYSQPLMGMLNPPAGRHPGLRGPACLLEPHAAIGVGREKPLANIPWWGWFHNSALQIACRFCKTLEGTSWYWKILGAVLFGGQSIQNESAVCHCGPLLSSSVSLPRFSSPHFRPFSRILFGTGERKCVWMKVTYYMQTLMCSLLFTFTCSLKYFEGYDP